jgi:hypothetical protein
MEVPELSVDVGSFQLTGASVVPKGTVIVMSSGKLVTTGGVLSGSSTTLTVKVRVTVFPAGSVNVYVTGVEPMGKEVPGSRLVPTVTVPELSVAVGTGQLTTELVVPKGTVTEMSLGKVWTAGGSVSCSMMTFTLNVCVTVFPAGSVKV